MKFIYPEGATPFNQDDQQNLIPDHIKTQAEIWLLKRKGNLLTTAFCKKLQKKMFDKTWAWAGNFRTYQIM